MAEEEKQEVQEEEFDFGEGGEQVEPPEEAPPNEPQDNPIFFLWSLVEPDKNDYKPFKPQFQPMRVIVQVDLPADLPFEILNIDGEVHHIITPEGMAHCAKVLADATFVRELAAKQEAAPDADAFDWGEDEDGEWGESSEEKSEESNAAAEEFFGNDEEESEDW